MRHSTPSSDATGAEPLCWLPWLLLCAAAVVLAFGVAAGPQLYDPGELTAAALGLGGSHPPGQTLHALLAHVLFRLPLGPIPARLGLLSAGCTLFAAGLAGQLCQELCAELGLRAGVVPALCRSAAVLGLLLSPVVLRQSLRVEVYALSLLLFVAAALLLLRWARDARAGYLWAAACLAGLAMCTHPPCGLAIALTAACLGALQPRRLLGRPRVVLGAVAAGLLFLLTLLYLPLRARAGAAMWGTPQTLSGFVRYVSAQAYMFNVTRGSHLGFALAYAGYLLRVTAGAPVIGALLLLSAQRGCRRPLVAGCVLAVAAAFASACLQPLEARNPDNVAYLGPALALLVVTGAAGFGAVVVAQRRPAGAGAAQAERVGFSRAVWRALALLGLACVALPWTTLPQLPAHLRGDVPALETLTAALVEAPPPRTLVVAGSELTAAAWTMAKAVDGARPDVALFATGLATSSWHWAQLAKHPGLSGRPRRAAGRDAHEGYTRGAVLAALPHVPVALEQDLPGFPPGRLVGGYTLLESARAPGVPDYDPRGIAERIVPSLARDVAAGPPGDAGAAAAGVRAYLCRRARRLLRLGRSREALHSTALALWQLAPAERALLHVSHDVPAARLPPVFDDRASYELSLEDAVREAAAELWALSARDAARTLLAHQLKRGDPHALLQLALLLSAGGDRHAALQLLASVERELPRLRSDVGAVRAALRP